MKPDTKQFGVVLDKYGEVELLATAVSVDWQRLSPTLLNLRKRLPPFPAISQMNERSLHLIFERIGSIPDVEVPLNAAQVAIVCAFLGSTAITHPEETTRETSAALATELADCLIQSGRQ